MDTVVVQKTNPGTRRTMSGHLLILPLVIVFLIPGVSTAYDLSQCLSEMIQQASSSMTVGDLRQQCEQKVTSELDVPSPALGERRKQDKDNLLQPFTLMAHKPNYILLGAYNSEGYDSTTYQEQFEDSSLEWGNVEAQFQMSIKIPLLVNIFDTVDVYGAYTNRSFWQLYEVDSSPFRETNHEPEAWVQHNSNWEFWGFTNSANIFGFVHQSNGRGGLLSRSWNRIYANFLVERGGLALSFKPYYRIKEDESSDDNADITDYFGHYELRAAYTYQDHVISAMSRNNLESGFDKGAVELSWSFPLWGYPFMKGYVQYFYGYGESLIDYDQKVNKIGVGVSLSDWL
jgi:phospholipase A1